MRKLLVFELSGLILIALESEAVRPWSFTISGVGPQTQGRKSLEVSTGVDTLGGIRRMKS